jgi:hypothetical protein
MKSWIALTLMLAIAVGTAGVAAQPATADRRELRERIEQHYEIVPLSDGIALRPRDSQARAKGVRLIEIAGGAIAVNGVAVTGRELRDRLPVDADALLQVSYLSAAEQKTLFAPPPAAPAAPTPPTEPLQVEQPAPSRDDDGPRRSRRSGGDRVRIFGDVVVDKDEEISGQAVAVFGSVRVDGKVNDQVVSVFGSIDLGPTAVVGGDVVAVGGRIRRSAEAQARGSVTEVSLDGTNVGVYVPPWVDGWNPSSWFGAFGAVPRLIGSGLRTLLLLLLTGIVLVVARRSVEASAERVADNPLKTTLVGLVAEILIPPVLFLTAFVLAISFIGIPLLLLLPFVVLLLILMALVGFAGTAAAIGRGVQRRFALGNAGPFISVVIGVLVILSPLLFGRLLALAGWPATPFAWLLVAAGFAVELLAWASGFGAVLSNAFTHWQGRRAARSTYSAPPVMP